MNIPAFLLPVSPDLLDLSEGLVPVRWRSRAAVVIRRPVLPPTGTAVMCWLWLYPNWHERLSVSSKWPSCPLSILGLYHHHHGLHIRLCPGPGLCGSPLPPHAVLMGLRQGALPGLASRWQLWLWLDIQDGEQLACGIDTDLNSLRDSVATYFCSNLWSYLTNFLFFICPWLSRFVEFSFVVCECRVTAGWRFKQIFVGHGYSVGSDYRTLFCFVFWLSWYDVWQLAVVPWNSVHCQRPGKQGPLSLSFSVPHLSVVPRLLMWS